MRRSTGAATVALALVAYAASTFAQPPPPGPPYPDPVEGTRVYDFADVLSQPAIDSIEATTAGIEERPGAQIVVYTQVDPEGDTPEEAEADARALIDQWGIGRARIDDGLVVLFDLDESRCHGQVQLHAGLGYQVGHLDNEARQAIFEEAMLPALRDCDFDTALRAAMDRIESEGPDGDPWGPDSDPWSVPADLAAILPSSIGDHQVLVDLPRAHMAQMLRGMRSVPMPAGKGLGDVRAVRGEGFPGGGQPIDRDQPAFTIWVTQVAGVPAAEMLEPTVDTIVALMPDKMRRLAHTEWLTIDGQDLYAVRWPALVEWAEDGNPEAGIYHFPKGEFLFQIMVPSNDASGRPSLAEIVASLS